MTVMCSNDAAGGERVGLLLMDDEEDDVFRIAAQYWPHSLREIKQEERGTQTAGRPLARPNGMLPCGVSEEPRRLFYGSAGLLLLAPPARPNSADDAMLPENQLAVEPPRRRPLHSVEASIGQKLQMIGDQFYQEHMLQHRNQRNHQPFWLRLASALYVLLFEREPAARWRGVDQ
ncbi:hypothetical protein P4O66_011791, partial [Electrophorus voltai]